MNEKYRLPLVALFVTLWAPAAQSPAEEPAARVVRSHGYTQAIELKLGKTRAVLCPQAGGRVLEPVLNVHSTRRGRQDPRCADAGSGGEWVS